MRFAQGNQRENELAAAASIPLKSPLYCDFIQCTDFSDFFLCQAAARLAVKRAAAARAAAAYSGSGIVCMWLCTHMHILYIYIIVSMYIYIVS